MEDRIPKVSKKSLMMDTPRPAQAEKSEMTVKRTPDSEGMKGGDDTRRENTERFFLTQV